MTDNYTPLYDRTAVDYGRLGSLTQEEAREYLRELYSGGIGAVSMTGGANEYDPYFYTTPSIAPGAAGLQSTEEGRFTVPLTKLFDPNRTSGEYGHYEGVYDSQGNLVDVQFKKDERHQGFLAENLETIGPLAVLGAMGAGSGLFSGLGGAGAGVTEASLGELGINTALPAGTAGGVSGITEAALGELGINTSLPMGAEGGVWGGTGLSGEVAADLATATGGDVATLLGDTVADALSGEALKDTTGLERLIWESSARDAALQQGLSEGLANTAAQVAGGLEGSGMSMADAIASGLSAASEGAATGLVGASGEILGGGGALTAGLTGMGAGAVPASITSLLRDAAGSVRNVANTARPAANAIRSLFGGSGSGSSGSGGAGMLGGLGGILGLALLYSQLNKDRNAQPANATPVVQPRRMTTVQNPYTVDESGKRKAPFAHFGQPIYYAGGGGIGGLAAGGSSRAVRGPGDGTSDSIPATINGKEPAALADGEFVIDARTVAELGNGSSEAGTRKLEAMVSRVHAARTKAKRGEDSNADRHMPA